MLDQFLLFIKKKKLFQTKEKILLAVSGGMDSVVMAELFHQAGFKFAIAHCNFQLRGKESDGDEKFVRDLAKKYRVKFFSTRFGTEKEMKEKKISVQMAARDLRYKWFEEIISSEDYAYISTAHHLSDSMETFFINLLRGTGIEGITGIDAKIGNIIRPLLFASHGEIKKFAKQNGIKHREDSSNQSDDYLRNRIRHHLIPVFKSLSPAFEKGMSDNMSHFAFAAKMYRKQITDLEAKFLKKEKDFFSISLKELKKQEDAEQLLYELLRPFDFNFIQCAEILNENIATNSGKTFLTKHFRAVRDRDKILIDAPHTKLDQEFVVAKDKKTIAAGLLQLKTSFTEKKRKTIIPTSETEQWLDADLLKFPLIMRKWRAGDFFYPLGMKHRKKLSDFFIDQKVNLFDKEKMHVLTSENKIVCILGHRIDDRFKITDKTKRVYKLKVKENKV